MTDEPDNQTILRSLPLIDMQLSLKEGRPADNEDDDNEDDDDEDDDDEDDDDDDDDDEDDDDDDDDDGEGDDAQSENEPVVANGPAVAAKPDDAAPAGAVATSPTRPPAPSDAELRTSLRKLVDSLVEEDSTQSMR